MAYDTPETLSINNYGNFSLLNMSRNLLGSDIVFFSIKNVLFFPFQDQEDNIHYHLNPFGKMFLDILYTNHIRLIGYEEDCDETERSVFRHLFEQHGLFYLNQIIFPEDFHLTNADDTFYQHLHHTYGQKKKIGFLSRKTILYAKLHQLESVKYVHPMANPHRIPKKRNQDHSLFFSYGTFFANTTLFNGTLHQNLPYEQGFGRFSLFCYDFCYWLHEKALNQNYSRLFFFGDSSIVYECFKILFPSFPAQLLYLETDSSCRESDLLLIDKKFEERAALVAWKPLTLKQQDELLRLSTFPIFSLFPMRKKKKTETQYVAFSYLNAKKHRKMKKTMEQTVRLLSRKAFRVTGMNMGYPILQRTEEDDFQLEYLSSLKSGILDFMREFPDRLEQIGPQTSHAFPDPSVLTLLETTFRPKKKSFRKNIRKTLRKIPLARKCYKYVKAKVYALVRQRDQNKTAIKGISLQ